MWVSFGATLEGQALAKLGGGRGKTLSGGQTNTDSALTTQLLSELEAARREGEPLSMDWSTAVADSGQILSDALPAAKEALSLKAQYDLYGAGQAAPTDVQGGEAWQLLMDTLTQAYQGDINRINAADRDDLDVDDALYIIRGNNLTDLNRQLDGGATAQGVALTPVMAALAEELNFLDRRHGWESVFYGRDEALGAFGATLEQQFMADYEEGTQRRLAYLPEGIDRETAINGLFHDLGRYMDDGQKALLIHAADQVVASGGGGFIDTTLAYTQSSIGAAEARARDTSTDDYLRASGDYLKFLVSGEMNPVLSGLNLPGATLNYLGAATADSVRGSLYEWNDDKAPADVITMAGANLLFEAALSASGVGKGAVAAGKGISTAGMKVLKASDNLLTGLKTGALKPRWPLELNREALYRMNSNPVDLLKVRSPLARTDVASEAHSVAQFAKLKDHLRSISKPNFKVSIKDNGAIRFHYGNLNKQQGIDGTLDQNGILRFEIQAHGDPASKLRNRLGSGSDMFEEMVHVLGPDNINGIEGIWSRQSGLTTNLDQLYENKEIYRMDDLDAAAETWTGRQAWKLGMVPREVAYNGDGLRVLFMRVE